MLLSHGMAKQKFKFNPNTLNFETITYGLRDYLLTALRYLFAGTVIGGIGVVIYASFFKDPQTARLSNEIDFLESQLSDLNAQLDTLRLFAEELEQRDDGIYRSIFGAPPFPDHIRNGGVGGSDRYRAMKGYESSESVIETRKKINRLERELVAQSKSYDEVIALARRQSEMLACIPAIQPVANKDLKRLASGFGVRIHPIYRIAKMHTGTDFTADIGTEIYATGNGVIESVDSKLTGYGHHVIINHGFGFQSLYAHMSRVIVHPGQKILRGQIIGYVGNSGISTGPHLHYEVVRNGEKVDPAFYFYNDITPEQYEALLERASSGNQSFD